LDFEAENDGDKLGPQVLIEGANLNHWIEGPGIIRRGGVSYLTYTGNHVVSRGYRVAYSYSTAEAVTPASFVQPKNNVNFISTEDDFYGLGHSSNAYGPDLDSIYTAYHNLNGGRRYNLDRYLTNGVRLTANGNTHAEADVPRRPDYEAADGNALTAVGGLRLSGAAADAHYTAEFNYTIGSGAAVLNYAGASDYQKIVITPADDTVKLVAVGNGAESVLASAALPAGNDYGKPTVLRVEKSLTGMTVFYNGMKRLSVGYSGPGGRIGYTAGAEARYTAFTNDVLGTGDFEAVKNLPAKIPAHSYLKGENRGFSFGAGTNADGPRMGERNAVVSEGGQYAVLLSRREDFVKYAVRAQTPSVYSVVAEVGRGSAGAVVEAVVGESSVVRFDVPNDLDFGEDDYIPVVLGSLELSGRTTVKLRLWKGEFKFRQLEFYADAQITPLSVSGGEWLNASFRSVAAGNYTVRADGALASGGDGYFMLLGGAAGAANFEYEADVAVSDSAGEGGVVFRAKNYSYHADQPAQGFQGYYLQIKERIATLFRYDYGSATLGVAALVPDGGGAMFPPGAFARVRVRCEHNRIAVWAGGRQIFDLYDNFAFMDGQIGFYSKNGVYAYRELTYSGLA
jgi:hypothetical protein